MKKLDIQKNGKPCIYLIKNKINEKIYIGSAIGHYRRKAQHFYLLRRNIHWNSHLQSAYNKYGEENMEFSVIEFIDDLSKLSEKESFYIKKFKSTNKLFGYNIRIDCETNLGKKWPIESRIKFSLSKKGIKPPHLNYTAIAKQNNKAIVGVNKDTKNLVEFDSIKEAGEVLKIDRTSISKVLNGNGKSAGNYYWNFAAKSA